MIKLSYMEIMHPNFREAANVIWNSAQLDGKTSYSAHRVKKGIDKVLKEIPKLQNDLAVNYCKFTEVGEEGKKQKIAHRDPRGSIMFESPEKQDEFEEAFTKMFTEKYLELKVNKIDFNCLMHVKGLTPSHWEFLSPIVENLPAEEEETDQTEVPSPLLQP